MKKALAALVVALGTLVVMPAAHAAEPARVLIVGDSVTQGKAGDYSWRYFAWQQLAGRSVDFVGPHRGTHTDTNTYGGTYADPNFDQDHAARWGQAMWQPLEHPDADSPAIGDLIATYDPQVVVEALGVNDLAWAHMPAAQMSDQVRTWVGQARAAKPSVDIILGGVPQEWVGDAAAYNAGLPALAAELTTAESLVTVAAVPDFTEGVDTYDFAHPTRRGEEKLGRSYAAAMAPFLTTKPIEASTAAATPAPAPAPTPVAQQTQAPAPQAAKAKPTAPAAVKAVRHGKQVKVSWRKVAGESYTVRCGGRTTTTDASRVKVRTTAAKCSVRATSDAGTSPWVKVRVKR